MTRQQADQIFMLTSRPEWKALQDVLIEDLQRIFIELSTCRHERLGHLQGEIAQIQRVKAIRGDAERVLNSED